MWCSLLYSNTPSSALSCTCDISKLIRSTPAALASSYHIYSLVESLLVHVDDIHNLGTPIPKLKKTGAFLIIMSLDISLGQSTTESMQFSPTCVNDQLKNRTLPGMLEYLPFDDAATNTCPGITNTPLTSAVPSVDGNKGLDSWRNKSRNTYSRCTQKCIFKGLVISCIVNSVSSRCGIIREHLQTEQEQTTTLP